jgi:hypothetical protein
MTESTSAAAQPALPPQIQLLEIVIGYWRSRALVIAAELQLADHLADRPLHVDDLVKRTNTHAPSLFRLLRALESIGLFQQVSPSVFGNTPLSDCLRRNVTGSWWAILRAGASIGEGEYEAWTGLLGNIHSGKTAFEQIYGYSYWEFLKRNPASADLFNEGMRSSHAVATPAITAAYDWSHFPVIADIGGGIGSQLVDILNAHPKCRGIVFDLPNVVASAVPHDRMERVGGSFFERVPSGADAYILRSVVHDWAEPEAVAILKTVRAAAKPDSRVILIEQVVPETPEYAYSKWQDLHMMVLLGGQERTAVEFRGLLEKASLELEQVVPTPAGHSLIISHPRD